LTIEITIISTNKKKVKKIFQKLFRRLYLHTVFHRLATARVSTLAFFCPFQNILYGCNFFCITMGDILIYGKHGSDSAAKLLNAISYIALKVQDY